MTAPYHAPVLDGPALILLFLPVCSQVWLLDQFGVLHDGQKAYPGAVEARKHFHSLSSHKHSMQA